MVAMNLTSTFLDESALIQQAQRGSLEAFNRLVLNYQDLVFRVACRILQDEAAAEDVSQIAFMRAYQKLACLYGSSFRVWLLKIVTHLCYDELRKKKRHPLVRFVTLAHEEDEEAPAEEYLPAADPGPEQVVVNREERRTIERCLASLPVEYRLALEMVDILGLDYAQSAQVMGCPIGTVKSRLARARMQMRQKLSEHRPA
ncbi:MAG: sigma-70 family RNA polymerase sigma factor [Anaerolineaceae bacterium]|nr:sigma-70 family RNA polymerase sigma factor [Anaerolineaceae bacterium]